MAARSGTEFVGEINNSSVPARQLSFDVGPGESYVLEFGENTLRFIRDGAYILDSTTNVAITNISATDPAVFTTATPHGFTNGKLVYLDQITAASGLDARSYRVDNATASTLTLIDEWGAPVSRLGFPVLVVARLTAHYILTTPYSYADGSPVRSAQAQDTMYLLSRDHPVHKLTRITPDSWTLVAETFAPSSVAPGSVAAAPLVGAGATVYTYVVSTVDAATGEESLPSAPDTASNDLSIAGNKNRVTWAAVAGAAQYLVYKDDNGVYGYIGGTTALQFDDENITADTSDSVQQARNPFLGAGNYPGCGTFFEQRLFLASTTLNPAGVWGSQSANPRNFGVSSPAKASDAVTFRLRANRVTQIESLVATEVLLLLTRSGEWEVTGGDQKGYLTPTNIVLRQRAFRGSNSVPPVLVGEFVVHVQRGGDAIRDLNLSRDVASTELSLLAKHILRGTNVVSMAYQQKPDSVVWVVTEDGNLAALTYMLEHDIWGWTRMDVAGGFVECATVVEEGGANGGEDAVYLQVKRIVNGITKRYIERLNNGEAITAEVAYHVDCGLNVTYETPTDVIYGLSHLEGQTLVALVDGNVVRDIIVENGAAALPNEGNEIAIGLGYTARIRTLDLDIGSVQGLGSVLGRHKTLTEVCLRVEATRGIFAGHADSEAAIEYRQRTDELWGDAIELYTGDLVITPAADWTTTGELVIEQRDPLPATINGILLSWEFGE